MKKVILFSILSVLLYSATGYTGTGETEAEAVRIAEARIAAARAEAVERWENQLTQYSMFPEMFRNAPAEITAAMTVELAARRAAVAEGRLEQAVRPFFYSAPQGAREPRVEMGGLW